MNKIVTFCCIILMSFVSYGQTITIDGYAFESGNRGYISQATVVVKSGDEVLKTSMADSDGHFVISVPEKETYTLEISAGLYEDLIQRVNSDSKNDENKIFVKAQMRRLPGYQFEVTMAEKREDINTPVDAIKNSRIDVFNNTTFEEMFVLYGHQDPQFTVPLVKGNHYTVLIRKEGYIAKRIEAFVDVEGCILCFEGLGKVGPGVTENLSQGNQIGVLLANVELEKVFSGKTIVLKDLYYDFGKAFLRPGAKKELDKLIRMMIDNPDIKLEIGSHTDSRGGAEKNKTLSERRAQSAVNYLTKKGINVERLIAFGYGESQLRNECEDGVKCSEEKHGYNRRTELKILDVARSNERIKSLAELKLMERGEQELEDFAFGGEVVQIDGDSTIVEEAKPVNLEDLAGGDPQAIIYKLHIHTSEAALEMDDELYSTHKNLEEVKTDSGYKYLIGSFPQLLDAQDYLKSTVKFTYPAAKIIKFMDGKIID